MRTILLSCLIAAACSVLPARAQLTPHMHAQPLASPLAFDLSLLDVPGYSRPAQIVVLGSARPPARDTRILIFRSRRKLPDGKLEPRQIQIALVAAANADDAWSALRNRANAPFGSHEPIPGLVNGALLGVDHAAHGPMFPPGTYTAAAVKGPFGVSVSHVCGPPLFREPVPDHEIALVESTLRALIAWSAGHWSPRSRPRIATGTPPVPVHLGDGTHEYPGMDAGFDTFVSVDSLADAAGLTHRWDPLREIEALANKTRRIEMRLNSNEYTESGPRARLHRPVRWFQGQCWISLEDAHTLFQRQVRQVAGHAAAPGAGDRIAALEGSR